ncbi:MAG: hypothetical protein QHC67_12930 [Sphingobium sp.]|uniref:hypothetical protein n=1 Tax=Sphingobium sp. TaxID=1912891 RepID=UPI0029B32F7B|nr:hypothetical protein [Sphingobium sp.]MDX3910703.1 hypothetical protein [Sphingobium sp.]
MAIASSTAHAGHSKSQPELVISKVAEPDASGVASVELSLLNGGSENAATALPAQIAAELTLHGHTTAVFLERAPETPRALNVTSGGFVKARLFLAVAKRDRGGRDGSGCS